MGDTATFTSASAQFTSADVGKFLDLHNSLAANLGRFEITQINSATSVKLVRVSGTFASETAVKWQLLASSGTSQRILFTSDLALALKKGLRISYIDEKDADFYDANWAEALDVLETQDLQILVALPTQTFSAIQQACRVHCETMSSTYHRRERVLLTGALQGLTVDQVTGVSLAAPEDIGVLEGIQGDDVSEILAGNIEDQADYGVQNSFGSTFRVVFFYPDQIVVQIGADRTIIDGFFMAAAAAGFLSGVPNVAIPLTNKVLAGFTILRNRLFRPMIKNAIAAAGITIVEPAIGGGTVLWGKTTTNSGYPEEEEISIIFIRDRIAQSLRTGFRGFIGTAESDTTQGSMMARAQGLLQSFITQGLITTFAGLQVARDSVEPRQWNVRVAVQPTYPVNWVYIRVSVGLLE
jgi:hypothetical protein